MGTGPSVVEFFSDGEYRQACFARGDFVYFNKVPTQQVSEMRIETDEPELPADFTGVFEPLELIHNDDGRLLLVAKVGFNADNNESMVSVYELDHNELKSEFMTRVTLRNFVSTSRTKSHVLFHLDEARSQSLVFNPFASEATVSKTIYKNVMKPSINDDIVFTEEAQYVEYHNLSKGQSDRVVIKDVGGASPEHC